MNHLETTEAMMADHLQSKMLAPPPYLVVQNLYRGPLPDQVIFQEIQKAGIRRLITLCDEWSPSRDTKQHCKHLGLENHHIPLSPFYRPGKSDIQRFLQLLDERDTVPTYVHCIHGRDRTGCMLGIFRLTQGWSYEDALSEMQEHGFCMDFTELIASVRSYADY
ncbi:MAG: tyrosine-protein phosphatase [Candidatus Obscuribacterales bacterium]|nr:tyrosine-protein phosphatase [Candidatus Obscuribacterales bacterium]